MSDPYFGATEKPLLPAEELGGIIVYDSAAKLVGCQKLENYFEESKDDPNRNMDPYLLFSRQEVDSLSA